MVHNLSKMTGRHDRLRKARMEAGFERQRDVLSRFPDWKANTYKSNENGNAPFSFDAAKAYARAFKVRAEWLYAGTGAMRERGASGVPILGKVAAGAEGYFDDDFELGAARDHLAPLPSENRICLIVEGDSMIPRFRPGEKVVFGEKYDDPTPLIGREVMARLKDGRKLLKVLRPGAKPGLWTLFSINSAYDPIEDVELEWALPFEELRP